MKTFLTLEELAERLPEGTLPLAPNSERLDTARIKIALQDATGIIVSQLPWLLDEAAGDIREAIPPQFESAIRSFCSDIARHKQRGRARMVQNDNEPYRENRQGIQRRTFRAERAGKFCR